MGQDYGLEGIEDLEVGFAVCQSGKDVVEDSVVAVPDYKSQRGQDRRKREGRIAHCEQSPAHREAVAGEEKTERKSQNHGKKCAQAGLKNREAQKPPGIGIREGPGNVSCPQQNRSYGEKENDDSYCQSRNGLNQVVTVIFFHGSILLGFVRPAYLTICSVH